MFAFGVHSVDRLNTANLNMCMLCVVFLFWCLRLSLKHVSPAATANREAIAVTRGNNDRDDVMYMIFCRCFHAGTAFVALFLSLLCLVSSDGKNMANQLG